MTSKRCALINNLLDVTNRANPYETLHALRPSECEWASNIRINVTGGKHCVVFVKADWKKLPTFERILDTLNIEEFAVDTTGDDWKPLMTIDSKVTCDIDRFNDNLQTALSYLTGYAFTHAFDLKEPIKPFETPEYSTNTCSIHLRYLFLPDGIKGTIKYYLLHPTFGVEPSALTREIFIEATNEKPIKRLMSYANRNRLMFIESLTEDSKQNVIIPMLQGLYDGSTSQLKGNN